MLSRVYKLIGICILIYANKVVLGQNYVELAPTANQTVVQPSGTKLSINNLAVPGAISLGTGSNSSVIQGNLSYVSIGYNGGDGSIDPSYATTNMGPLVLSDTSNDYAPVRVSNDGGN